MAAQVAMAAQVTRAVVAQVAMALAAQVTMTMAAAVMFLKLRQFYFSNRILSCNHEFKFLPFTFPTKPIFKKSI